MEYTDVHRALLQYFMLKKARTQTELIDILTNVMREYGENVSSNQTFIARDIEKAIEVINEELNNNQLHMMIKQRYFIELDGQMYWVLVNLRGDDVARLSGATMLKDWELLLIKDIMRELAEREDGFVTKVEIYKLSAQASNPKSRAQVEPFIHRLIEEQWIAEGLRKGSYTIGIRAATELADVLTQLGAPSCETYHFPVVKTKYYHEWIASLPSGNPKTSYQDHAGFDEDESDDEAPVQRTRQSRRSSRSQPVDDVMSDEDVDEAEVDDDGENNGHEITPSRKSSRRTGPRSTKTELDDEIDEEEESPPKRRRSSRGSARR